MWTPANLNLEWILRIWTVAFISIALMLFVCAWLLKAIFPSIKYARACLVRAQGVVLGTGQHGN